MSEVYPYQGYAVAAPRSDRELGIPSEPPTATFGVPYQAIVTRPGAPPCAQSNSFVADWPLLTRVGADQLSAPSVENE